MDHAQRQRAVAAGTHAEPEIGFLGRTGLARIDHNKLSAARFGLIDSCRGRGPGGVGIETPEDNALRVIIIRRRRGHAVSVLGTPLSVPIANVERSEKAGAAESVSQAFKPARAVGNPASRRRAE